MEPGISPELFEHMSWILTVWRVFFTETFFEVELALAGVLLYTRYKLHYTESRLKNH